MRSNSPVNQPRLNFPWYRCYPAEDATEAAHACAQRNMSLNFSRNSVQLRTLLEHAFQLRCHDKGREGPDNIQVPSVAKYCNAAPAAILLLHLPLQMVLTELALTHFQDLAAGALLQLAARLPLNVHPPLPPPLPQRWHLLPPLLPLHCWPEPLPAPLLSPPLGLMPLVPSAPGESVAEWQPPVRPSNRGRRAPPAEQRTHRSHSAHPCPWPGFPGALQWAAALHARDAAVPAAGSHPSAPYGPPGRQSRTPDSRKRGRDGVGVGAVTCELGKAGGCRWSHAPTQSPAMQKLWCPEDRQLGDSKDPGTNRWLQGRQRAAPCPLRQA